MDRPDEDVVSELTASLVAMGFTQHQAIKALKRSDYNLAAATDLLIAGDGGVLGGDDDDDDDSELALPRETMDNHAQLDITGENDAASNSFRLRSEEHTAELQTLMRNSS